MNGSPAERPRASRLIVTVVGLVAFGLMGAMNGAEAVPTSRVSQGEATQRQSTSTLRTIPRITLPRLTTTTTRVPRTTTTTSTTRVPRTTTTTTTRVPRTTTTTTSSIVAETTTTIGTTTTTVHGDHDHPFEDEPACVYRRDLLISTVDLTARLGALGLAVPTRQDVTNLSPQALRGLNNAHIYPYAVVNGADPLAVAGQLVGEGIAAGPVTMVMPAGHWTFVGDNAAVDLADPAPDVTGALSKPAQVASIDTGYSAGPKDPKWLVMRAKPASAVDGDQATGVLQGHGKFVASLIAQQRPNTRITVAGLTPVDPARFTGDGSRPVPAGIGFISDELQVWMAMQRLLGTGIAFDVLNLSVGAYGCPLSESALAFQAALISWYSTTAGHPVSAAVGNHEPGESAPRFLPAQMPLTGGPGSAPAFLPVLCAAPVTCVPGALYDVQSVDADGKQSAFSNSGHFSAIGENVVGVRLGAGTASIWSGSSFAAAVISAHLGGGQPLSDGAVVPLQGVTTKQP